MLRDVASTIGRTTEALWPEIVRSSVAFAVSYASAFTGLLVASLFVLRWAWKRAVASKWATDGGRVGWGFSLAASILLGIITAIAWANAVGFIVSPVGATALKLLEK